MEKYSAQISQYEKFCEELGAKPADVALAWLIANPVVTAPIIGPRTMEQLTESLRSLEIKLSQEQMDKLNEIWPGPKRESPEAFAW
jgi:aryl-alcohol dehydrogenase-like predicted oxidoreductase